MNAETKKLYYQNPYRRTFYAHVLECTPHGDAFDVVLDRTAFYPEGGGQPADTGVLNFGNVLDVHEKGGVIVHTVDRELPVGAGVTGGINWARRFALMQQHTGEHIVSGIAHRFFGLENVGFHMGSNVITVDWNGEVTADQLNLIETLANEAVYRDLAVKAEYPEPEELKKIDYRSKKELTGAVRIVTIPGYDVCAPVRSGLSKFLAPSAIRAALGSPWPAVPRRWKITGTNSQAFPKYRCCFRLNRKR
jgi:alanyl-tRNA synthetase